MEEPTQQPYVPRPPDDIQAAIADALSQYRAGVRTLPAAVVAQLNATIRAFQQELSDAYAQGAQTCPDCGALPHGMQRRPQLYEIGCLFCFPRVVQRDDLVYRRVIAAQGETPALAVTEWNAQHFVETVIT